MPHKSVSTSGPSPILEGIKRGDRHGGPTKLAQILHDSLTARCGLDVDDLTRSYLHWWRSGAFDTGPIFDTVFARIDGGTNRYRAVVDADTLNGGLTAGCNPAHRSAPLASCFEIRTDELADAARREAKITHLHPHAGDAAAIVVFLCRHLLEGRTWEEAKQLALSNSAIADAYQAATTRPLSPGGYALDAVGAALHFMDGDDALSRSMAFAGHGNYCPVIVGALLGASGAFQN